MLLGDVFKKTYINLELFTCTFTLCHPMDYM